MELVANFAGYTELLDSSLESPIAVTSRNDAAKTLGMINALVAQQQNQGQYNTPQLLAALTSIQQILEKILERSEQQVAVIASKIYSKINGNSTETRLVSIQPGEYGDAIQCVLKVTSLGDSCPEFGGLSYMWGDELLAREEILLEGVKFPITSSLASALRYLREKDRAVFYWIDAISINQYDLEERSSQVRYMRNIYARATGIVSWLGDEEEGSNDGMKLMAHLGREILKDNALRKMLLEGSRGGTSTFRDTVSTELGLWLSNLITTKPETWHNVCIITNRPYWRRAWVMQETAFTDNIHIACGQESISWNSFMEAISLMMLVAYQMIIRDPDFLGEKMETCQDGWCAVKDIRLRIQSGKKATFAETLVSLRQCLATDPRDKVFAFVGLQDSVEFPIDYLKPVHIVYRDVAKALIPEYNSLDILVACQLDHSIPNLPSWVPDWSVSETNRKPLVPAESFTSNPSNASVYNSSRDSNPDYKFSENLDELTVSGIVLDRIAEMGSSGNDPDFSQYFSTALALREKFIGRIPEEGDAQRREQVTEYADNFWRTLIVDRPAPSSVPFRTRIDESQAEDYRLQFDIRFELKPLSAARPPAGTGAGMSETQYAIDFCSDYILAMQDAKAGRRVALTEKRYFAMIPSDAEVGDHICVFLGAQVPFVLRQTGAGFRLVGDCFVQGFMDGEIMRHVDQGQAELRDFVLV